MIGLPDVLTEERDHFVTSLVIEGQKVHSKLVVDEFGHSFPIVVLLGSLRTVDIVLDSPRDSRDPVFDRRHAFLTQEDLSVLAYASLSRFNSMVHIGVLRGS